MADKPVKQGFFDDSAGPSAEDAKRLRDSEAREVSQKVCDKLTGDKAYCSKLYGQGHDMSVHGEGQPYGAKK